MRTHDPRATPAPDETSRYGPAFWTGVVVGWAAIGFGMVSLLSRAGATDPVVALTWIGGSAFVHDLVVVPVVLTLGWVLGRRLPGSARGIVAGALILSGLVALAVLPSASRVGAQPDNPSFLPRDVGAGLVVVLALIWTIAAIALVARSRNRSRPRGTRAGMPRSTPR